jgi:hypothetical protein
MPTYVVRYEVDAFDVETPHDAAEFAAEHLVKYADRGVYDVIAQDGTITKVDLSGEDE